MAGDGRSIEEIIASFAYKSDGAVNHHDDEEAKTFGALPYTRTSPRGIGGGGATALGRGTTSSGACPAGGRGRRKRRLLSESTVEDDAEQKEKRPRRRPTINISGKKESRGKPVVVVSRFFPRPQDAVASSSSSSSVVDDKKRRLIAARRSKPKTWETPSQFITASSVRKGKHCRSDKNADDCGIAREDAKDRVKMRKKKNAASSQLTAAEKMSDAYRRVAADSMWEPPASCHHLLQERHSFDPWRVLVICMLLNVTTGRQVGKVLPGLFLLCPDAETTTKVPEEEIEKVIQTLGLQRKRARMIKQFSCEYLGNDWTHVTQLHGVGKYAADAYAIFCSGKPQEVVPQDHKLVDYWKFVCGNSDS